MKVLAFFAHPDDETMLCGGTLALLSQEGFEVHLACATRGEGGECGEPPVCSSDDLGMVRENELLCAAKELGCQSVHFLDFIDPKVGQDNTLFPYADNIEDIVKKLMPLMHEIMPIIMISHGSNGEYGHPAHVISHKAALAAVEMYPNPIYLYTVQAIFPHHPKPKLANQNDPADIILDCSSVLEQKINAALCHKTQHALFVRNSSKEAQRNMTVPEVITSLESLHLALALRTNNTEEDPITKILNNSNNHSIIISS